MTFDTGNESPCVTDFFFSVEVSEGERGTKHDFKSFYSIGTSVQCPQTVKEFEDRPTHGSSVQ